MGAAARICLVAVPILVVLAVFVGGPYGNPELVTGTVVGLHQRQSDTKERSGRQPAPSGRRDSAATTRRRCWRRRPWPSPCPGGGSPRSRRGINASRPRASGGHGDGGSFGPPRLSFGSSKHRRLRVGSNEPPIATSQLGDATIALKQAIHSVTITIGRVTSRVQQARLSSGSPSVRVA